MTSISYEKVKNLKPEEFKRLCSVHPETFSQMSEVVRSRSKTKLQTGRPGKLSIEDQLLMALEYWREERTYFHIGQSWGVNESYSYRIIRKIEDILISSREFSLRGQKKLCYSNYQIEVVVVDVTESLIERPKKTKTVLVWQKEKTYTKISSCRRPKYGRNPLYRAW